MERDTGMGMGMEVGMEMEMEMEMEIDVLERVLSRWTKSARLKATLIHQSDY